MSAAALLDRLEGVKSTGSGRWIAKCPAHADKRPSLSIRETDNGMILIHDFGGCATGDVLSALGLSLANLYPNGRRGDFSPSHSRIPARDLLEIISHEITVAALILNDVLEARALDETQWSRLAQAASRIGRAFDACR